MVRFCSLSPKDYVISLKLLMVVCCYRWQGWKSIETPIQVGKKKPARFSGSESVSPCLACVASVSLEFSVRRKSLRFFSCEKVRASKNYFFALVSLVSRRKPYENACYAGYSLPIENYLRIFIIIFVKIVSQDSRDSAL